MLDRHDCFQFFITCTNANNANNATHYVKLCKKKRESSKRDDYIISPRVIVKDIIILGPSVIESGFLKERKSKERSAAYVTESWVYFRQRKEERTARQKICVLNPPEFPNLIGGYSPRAFLQSYMSKSRS